MYHKIHKCNTSNVIPSECYDASYIYAHEYTGSLSSASSGEYCMEWRTVYEYFAKIGAPRFSPSDLPDIHLNHNHCRVIQVYELEPACFVGLPTPNQTKNWTPLSYYTHFGLEKCGAIQCMKGSMLRAPHDTLYELM